MRYASALGVILLSVTFLASPAVLNAQISVAVRFSFGRFYPPGLPFGASNNDKIDAPIISETSISLSEYLTGREVVRARVDWSGPPLSSVVSVRVEWYKSKNGDLTLLVGFSKGWHLGQTSAFLVSWMGHKQADEIDEAGEYRVRFYATGWFDHWTNFEVSDEASSIQTISNSFPIELSILVGVAILIVVIGLVTSSAKGRSTRGPPRT